MVMLTALVALCLAPADDVPTNAQDTKPLKVGTAAPDADLTTIKGTAIKLATQLNGKPAVLVFYRGGWCPFCNVHLSELGQIADEVKAKGVQIIGISPDTPAELEKSIGKNKITYTLLSDSKADAMRKFGIAFRVDDETFNMYRDRFNLDLEKASGEKHHYLPVPAVFVINAKGIITFAYSNPDYKVRLKGQEILKALD